MGPDEEKNYADPVIMHLNPETGEWEEVGKLKDIKEIKGDIQWRRLYALVAAR